MNSLLEKVGTVPELNFDDFGLCDEDQIDQLPQIHLGVSEYSEDADTPEDKYSINNADYAGGPEFIVDFLELKSPNYAEPLKNWKKFKKWIGKGK